MVGIYDVLDGAYFTSPDGKEVPFKELTDGQIVTATGTLASTGCAKRITGCRFDAKTHRFTCAETEFEVLPLDARLKENAVEINVVKVEGSFFITLTNHEDPSAIFEMLKNAVKANIQIQVTGIVDEHYRHPEGGAVTTGFIKKAWKDEDGYFFQTRNTCYKLSE